MSNRLTNILAGTLLATMFFLTVLGIKNDTFTFDETAHVPAGYSYLTQRDYRLNPEHPPLVKDLAAIPLLFLDLNFPKNDPNWIQKDLPPWWTQFDFGTKFLYNSDNNPDQILFWSHLAMICLLIFLGWFLFYVAKKLFTQKTALISLFLFTFSPLFLSNGKLVTTDVGAAFGVLLSTYFWLKFLKEPSKKNVLISSITFGIAMILKFNLILLIPFFGLITVIYAWLFGSPKPLVNVLRYAGLALLSAIIGVVFIIWPVYFYHIYNFPADHQLRDTQYLLSTTSVPKFLSQINIWMAKNPILRPFAQYLLGALLAVNRTTTGNTTFFLGQVSAEGWKSYFPIVYFIKNPFAFHILSIIALLYLAWLIKKPPYQKLSFGTGPVQRRALLWCRAFWQNTFQGLKNWIKFHLTEFAMLCFLAIYWLTSLTSKLNIGVRHLLPVLPFTFILVAYVISLWLKPPFLKAKYLFLSALAFWQIVSVVSVAPHFLAYFNEAVGGPDKGYLYVVDSNLDWGQDLKRLKQWLDDNKIDKIYLDYFGGGNPQYYLNLVRDYKDKEKEQGEQISNGVKEKFIPWSGTKLPNEIPKGSYIAVSASQLQGGRGIPVKGYDQPTDYYMWIYQYEPPIAKIGYSIFVYKIQ